MHVWLTYDADASSGFAPDLSPCKLQWQHETEVGSLLL